MSALRKLRNWWSYYAPVFEQTARYRESVARKAGAVAAHAEFDAEKLALERQLASIGRIEYRREWDDRERITIRVSMDNRMLSGNLGDDKDRLAEWIGYTIVRELRHTHVLHRAHDQERADEMARPIPPWRLP